MARSIRIEYAGAFYHVMARGNRRESIFLDEEDRRFFLQTLSQACAKTGWRVHAWVLMGNHYHLLIQTPEANLVSGMKWLQNTYTRRFNTRHRLWGKLFGDRYKAVLVEGEGYYYETLLDYIHLNPVRAKLVDVHSGQSVRDYPWSSVAAGYALLPRDRTTWLAVTDGLRAFGYEDTAMGRRSWVARLNKRARSEAPADCGLPIAPANTADKPDRRRSHLREGWYWGSQAFAEKALKLGEGVLKRARHRSYQGSLESRSHNESQARAILKEAFDRSGLGLREWAALPGSDLRKVAVARSIKEQTTMSLKWIAEEVRMKSPANVSQQIRRYSHRPSPSASPNESKVVA